MITKRPLSGRLAAMVCAFGFSATAFVADAAGIKGIGAGRRGALPGAEYLLRGGLGSELARASAHGRGAAALPGGKGTTTVAAGINAFLLPGPGTGVASDGSLGTGAVSYTNSTYTIPASVGTQVGGNLFESFSQFNLLEGETADFQGPASVQNILARVTGGSASSIDGTIESDIQGANLFLINPAGVMFGPNASLNVSGAFTVSTADYVKLSDGGKFNASLGADDMLTTAPVSAFGFVNASPAPVSFSGSQLSVPAGTGLNVIAGNVTLDSPTGDTTTPGAALSAPSGGLTIFSTASAGEVPFSLSAPGAGYGSAVFSALGSVSLSNGSSMKIDGAGGGALVITAGALTLDDSRITSANSGSIPGGDLTLEVADALSVLDGSQIVSAALGSGAGGSVSIQAGTLDIYRLASTAAGFGIATFSAEDASGNAGDLNVTVAGAINLEGGEVISYTLSAGNGGNVSIHAGSVNVDGEAAPDEDTGIYVETTVGTGNSGSLSLTISGALEIEGGVVYSDTYLGGDGGNVTVQAGSLTLEGAAAPGLETGIAAETGEGTGDAGDLDVTVTGALDIDGGEITTTTYSAGKGGNLTVQAGSLNIDNSATPSLFTGIGAQSALGATGNAGNLTVTVAGALNIEASGEITASTHSMGKAGDLTIQAQSMAIDGAATPDGETTGVFDDSWAGESGDSGGTGGNLNVTIAGALSIGGGGLISGGTFTSGNGGNVNVDAGSLVIDGVATPNVLTGIGSQSNPGATGNAGPITVDVKGAVTILAAGEITAGTFTSGDGGSLTLEAGSLEIDGAALPSAFTGISSQTTRAATGNAGPMTVDVKGAVTILASGEISASTFTSGNGGSLTLRAGSLVIDGAEPTSGVFTGIFDDSKIGETGDSGGNGGSLRIAVSGGVALTAGGEINTSTSTAGNAGDVAVSARGILIDGEGSFISAEADGTGAGGKVVVTAGDLLIRDGGGIDTDTHDTYAGGDITVNAGFISMSGDPIAGDDTYIDSDSHGAGRAGDVTVTAGAIVIDGKGYASSTYISAEADGTGPGGKVTVNAGTLVIRGGGGIDTDTNCDRNAGDLTVNAGSLSIIGDPNQSYISSDTDSGGKAGDVTVNAGYILINGENYYNGAFISADADDENSAGAGGNVTINAGTMVVRAGGDIDTDTDDTLNAGNLTVNAGSLSIIGGANDTTNISSDTDWIGRAGDVSVTAGSVLIVGAGHQVLTGITAESAPGAIGNGGNIKIAAGTLSLESGGGISATTSSSGNGGNIAVNAQNIDISGYLSGIGATSTLASGGGAAGGISIQCENLALEAEGTISAGALAAAAGDITIDVRQNVTLEDLGSISSSAGVSGGNINLRAGGTLYLLDSSISAAAGSARAASGQETNPNAGNGGNINIDPTLVVLDDSLISANAAIGQGGNIVVASTYFLNSGGEITATGATSGTVTIKSPDAYLTGALVGLPSAPVGAGTQLQETCAMAIQGDFSSFLAVGQGDIEPAPDEAQDETGDGGTGRRNGHVHR